MDIRDHGNPADMFKENPCLYLPCFDRRLVKVLYTKKLPFIELYMVLGYVSFAAKLRERRVVLFLPSKENLAKLRGFCRNCIFCLRGTLCAPVK